MERVRSVQVVRADGSEMDRSSSGSRSDDESTMLSFSHSEPIPPDAALVLALLTEKAVVVVPFELSIPLP